MASEQGTVERVAVRPIIASKVRGVGNGHGGRPVNRPGFTGADSGVLPLGFSRSAGMACSERIPALPSSFLSLFHHRLPRFLPPTRSSSSSFPDPTTIAGRCTLAAHGVHPWPPRRPRTHSVTHPSDVFPPIILLPPERPWPRAYSYKCWSFPILLGPEILQWTVRTWSSQSQLFYNALVDISVPASRSFVQRSVFVLSTRPLWLQWGGKYHDTISPTDSEPRTSARHEPPSTPRG